MKKFPVLFMLVLAVLVLVACGPVAQSQAVQLPEQLVTLIGMLVLVGFTQLAKYVLDKFGIDIQDRAAEIAAALSAVVVMFINYFLGIIPAAYDNWISALFSFLIVLLGGIGMFSLFLRKKDRG